ncbi:MAG: DsbA family protein [Candidatus Methylomirabilis sp.]
MRVGATLEQLLQQYPKDVRLVFKMHPLPMHSNAMIAAQAAIAAHAQGKFLEVHKKLYENTAALSRDKVIELAAAIGLDAERFKKDLDSEATKAAIHKETKEVVDIGSMGTPASFVNGRYVNGAKPLSFFQDMVEEELRWAREGNRPAFTIGKNVQQAAPPQAAVAQGPDPNKVYNLPAGDAPAMGASQAKVTILHYLDYQ